MEIDVCGHVGTQNRSRNQNQKQNAETESICFLQVLIEVEVGYINIIDKNQYYV